MAREKRGQGCDEKRPGFERNTILEDREIISPPSLRGEARSSYCFGRAPVMDCMSLMFIFMPPGMTMSPGSGQPCERPSISPPSW
jgi:hypothetical protein